MFKVKGHGSGSKVTWVKVKGQLGQTRPKGHDIGRWVHANIKLHFLFQFTMSNIIIIVQLVPIVMFSLYFVFSATEFIINATVPTRRYKVV